MFRQKRNQETTHGKLLRSELGQSVDHALRAAGYAAGGVRATMGPRVAPAARRVRGAAVTGWSSTRAALAPLGEAAQRRVTNQRPEEPRTRRRWPRVTGLLAGGAAVGAAAAFVMRRRRQRQWEEYDPTEAVAGVGGYDGGAGGEPIRRWRSPVRVRSSGGAGRGTTPPSDR